MNSENFTGKYLFGSPFWKSHCLTAIQKSFFGRVPSIKYFWVSFQNKFQLNKEEHIRFVALSLRPIRLNIQNIFRSNICIDYIKLITAQKMKFSMKDCFSKRAVSCGFGQIYWRNCQWKSWFFVQCVLLLFWLWLLPVSDDIL